MTTLNFGWSAALGAIGFILALTVVLAISVALSGPRVDKPGLFVGLVFGFWVCIVVLALSLRKL